MSLPVLLIGFGGHARVLLDVLLSLNIPVVGATDTDPDKLAMAYRGVRVVGSDEFIEGKDPRSVLLANGIGSISTAQLRRTCFEKFKNLGFEFVTTVHPSAIVSKDTKLGEGAQIMAGAVVQPSVEIGNNVIINTRASIDHDCFVGDHVHIAPGATLSGSVSIGKCSLVGTGATIIQNIVVGNNCVIGAGATLVQDVDDDQTLVGVPAKKTRSR